MADAPTITATARLKIVKPVDGDWDALGRVLRALRAPAHRVLNAVVRELELNGPGEWWAPTPGDVKAKRDRCHPRTASYRAAGFFWKRERDEAAARVAKGKPYTGDAVIAEVEPTSSVQLGLAGAAYARHAKFAKERWKGTTSLPSFKGGSPIYVAGQGASIRAEDGNVILDMNIVSGGRTRLIVQACDGSGFARLRAMLDAPDMIGDVRIIEDDRGKGGWYAFVAFTFPKPEVATGGVMALHRGLKCFLTAAVARSTGTARDAYTAVLETGDDVLRHKAAYSARRRSLGQQKRQVGAGACGHGTARREEHVTKIEDAEARWVKSKCQEVAAHAVKLARVKGVGTILLEDWGNPAKDGAPELGAHVEYMVRSFPLAQLRETIEWAAKLAGIGVEIVRTDNNSRDCPHCGHRHEKAQYGTFHCEKCELERNSDAVFAWNMLARYGKVPGIAESNEAMKKAAEAIRGGKTTTRKAKAAKVST